METREEQQLNLIPVSVVNNCEYRAESSSSFPSIPHSSSKEAFYRVIRCWASKKFMTRCVILLPIAITFYTTWWFIHFVHDFSPQSISILGSAYLLGASVLSLGEWLIKKMPLISYIYSASKQISTAISPDQKSKAFKEVAIIRHPRIGEYAFGFITSPVILHGSSAGSEELNCVYVPTNHLYIGDMFLISSNDIVRPNLSAREGIEIVISGGMSVPRMLTTLDARVNEATEIAGLENSTSYSG
ncbi:hypothetical protein CXB51_026451 [Gossypium anomalum]|uniref:Protein LIKE COV 3 n=1 Tax=Gossypium anomalum TaxID=47600 RepID=A0A8J5YEA4_9ROSI|nr:hypothetical protein CXB51_026451 [Gossypium anomalum]